MGRFLIEAGPFLDNDFGKSAKNFFAQHPESHPEFAPEGWGASVEFLYVPEERENKVYENIHITRTSLPESPFNSNLSISLYSAQLTISLSIALNSFNFFTQDLRKRLPDFTSDLSSSI